MANANKNVLVYKIDKTPTGVVGQCIAVPAVIAQAESPQELNKEMGIMVEGYFQACPEAKKTIVSALVNNGALGKVEGFGELKIDLS